MRQLHLGVRFWLSIICLTWVALVVPGCKTDQPLVDPAPSTNTVANLNPPDSGKGKNRLQKEDHITISFSGTPVEVQPIEKVVSDDGTITLDHIDHPLQAAGKFPQDLAEEIHTNLVPDYYSHCNVTVIPEGQYFYVLGEVNQSGNGGRFPYFSGITVTKAIATAGGFNPFAYQGGVQLTRLDGTNYTIDCPKALKDPAQDLEVYPGDRVYVPKRNLWHAATGAQ
jgi:protein involved in polysaccharide export with SLBB domain